MKSVVAVNSRSFLGGGVFFILIAFLSPVSSFAETSPPASHILEQIENAFVSLAEKVRPAVVNLSPYVSSTPSVDKGGLNKRRPTNSAAGVIVDPKKGIIVTNSHVVRDARKITVTFLNGDKMVGRVFGRDEDTDLAVVKIDTDKPLPSVPMADSSQLKVGQLVFAVGNPYGLNDTLTSGIVSGLNRENINLSRYEDFIQTDASINPGNSGGPLINIRGEIVGINTAIINYAQNIGFAIPSNIVKHVMNQLIEYGEVRRGWLGVGIEPVTKDLAGKLGVEPGQGVYVNSAFNEDPAYIAGIREGDIIMKIGGAPVDSPNSMIRLVGAIHPGQKINIEVLRNKAHKVFVVELANRKERELLASVPPEIYFSYGMEVIHQDVIQGPSGKPVDSGVVISKLVPGSSAVESGFQLGDVVTEIDGNPVGSPKEFHSMLKSLTKTEPTSIKVLRGTEILSLELKKR